MERIEVKTLKNSKYDIVLHNNFDLLGEELKVLDLSGRKVGIICDSNTVSLFSKEIEAIVKPLCNTCVIFSFEQGEENKNLQTVDLVYDFLVENKFDRNDVLLALGGGVVGDLTGYVAATYMRGIRFVQIPTTLLSQVDSSIGGKTGVDFKSYKNMVGAFHMPSLVYINVKVLDKLDDRQYFSGMAEILKAGLIKDGKFYEWLIDHFVEIGDREEDILLEMIQTSCMIKRDVVEKDPYEKGDRALLNFGHTIGHAIEKQMDFKYLHGECVALGCICSAYISWKRELLSMEEYYEIRDMFVPFNLPISSYKINPLEVLKYTKSDKKMDGNHVKFVLLKKVGKAIIETDVTEEEILNAINEVHYDEEELYE